MEELARIVGSVPRGATVAFGGKTLHRAPVAFSRELVRQGITDLTVIGVANSIEIDLLCGAELVDGVHFGYVGFESLGLAPYFRKAVESGHARALEGTCYTVATMLRGAKQGVPFMPIAGLDGSDLPQVRDDFAEITCPFTGTDVYAVRSVQPDIAVIHANEADRTGNARFFGADLTENLLAKAADRVIVTAEKIVSEDAFIAAPEQTNIPAVLVDEVIEVPYGAHPCSCPGAYDYDQSHLETYLSVAKNDGFSAYRSEYIGASEEEYQARVDIENNEELAWEQATMEVSP